VGILSGEDLAGKHILVPSMELATTELFKSLGSPKINEPGHPSRQPGYLSETRGFPSPPFDGFGYFLKVNYDIDKLKVM